ncbi:Uncharacterised protein [Vibrio cholerae]|nr:Uncharacterised protein [Vibrio cholerae]
MIPGTISGKKLYASPRKLNPKISTTPKKGHCTPASFTVGTRLR